MKRNLFTTLCCLIITLCFFSCEEIIEPDLGDVEPKLVVTSNFTADNALEVFVSQTTELSANSNNAIVVAGASVRLFQGEQFIEQLTYLDLTPPEIPKYVSENFIPEVGIPYTIKVYVPGFEQLEATSFIPASTEIGALEFSNTINKENPNQAVINFNIDLGFQDDGKKENYYHILFKQDLLLYQVNVTPVPGGGEEYDTVTFKANRPVELSIDLLDENFPAVKFIDGQSLLIEDATFNGEEINMEIFGSYFINLEQFLPGDFTVEVRTVSEDYYLYYTTLTHHVHANQDALTEAGVVVDNVENGCGIFAGYNSTINVFSVSEN